MAQAEPGTTILALNSGSSSLKFGLYRINALQAETLLAGEAEAIGDGEGRFEARGEGGNAARLEELVGHRSGLMGISGIGSDMRRLHEAAASNADARLAIQMFSYSVRKQIAAMVAALEGVDLTVFTGGIGEHDAEVRAGICDGLS